MYNPIIISTIIWAPLRTICIGLVLFGLGLEATLVSAFVQLLQDAIQRGYPDDVGTYGLVSGLWTSMTALGFFLGSSVGILLHYVGFQWGTLFILVAQFLLVGFLTIYIFLKNKMSIEGLNVAMENVDSEKVCIGESKEKLNKSTKSLSIPDPEQDDTSSKSNIVIIPEDTSSI